MTTDNGLSVRVPITIPCEFEDITLYPLIDNGSTHCLISPATVERYRLRPFILRVPMTISNSDGSSNRNGPITAAVPLCFDMGNYTMTADFYVADVGSEEAILGMTWLRTYNPEIN